MQPTVARPPRRAASTILSRVHRGVASRVVAREHLGERWFTPSMCRAKSSPYSKSNSSCPLFSVETHVI
jgi:hypothetical protein